MGKNQVAGQLLPPPAAGVRGQGERGRHRFRSRGCGLPFGGAVFERGSDHLFQLVEFDRFGHEIERAQLDRRHRVFDRPVGGQEDAGGRVGQPPRRFEDFHPVAVGHPQVGEHEVEPMFFQLVERGGAVGGGGHPESFSQVTRHRLAGVVLVVDDQEFRCLFLHGGLFFSAVPLRCRDRPGGTPRSGVAGRRGNSACDCTSARCRSAAWRLRCAAGSAPRGA